eukprot:TRINITY_DN314_c0_g1_i1.p1 TRINITY_DN314_c0_g1~~TRINITY_DN314_c0_g1_i1.p1  ORF type:complete len:190 (+),score=48.75 TRINITY_DN314_c0_g1_i1:112-681(+)
MAEVRTLATYVGDMHALTIHIQEPFERQLTLTKDIPEAHNVVEALVKACKDQIPILAARLEKFGNYEKLLSDKIKSAVSLLFGYGAAVIDSLRPLAASKALRDSYTAIHLVICGYMMLYSTATALKDTETAQLAEKYVGEWNLLGQRVMNVIPLLALKDLADDGLAIDVHAENDKVHNNKKFSPLFPPQ